MKIEEMTKFSAKNRFGKYNDVYKPIKNGSIYFALGSYDDIVYSYDEDYEDYNRAICFLDIYYGDNSIGDLEQLLQLMEEGGEKNQSVDFVLLNLNFFEKIELYTSDMDGFSTAMDYDFIMPEAHE